MCHIVREGKKREKEGRGRDAWRGEDGGDENR